MDELEAIRLADLLGLNQTEAARRMNISQPTFNRILASARRKFAECVVKGLAIRIASPEDSSSIVDKRATTGIETPFGRRRRRHGE